MFPSQGIGCFVSFEAVLQTGVKMWRRRQYFTARFLVLYSVELYTTDVICCCLDYKLIVNQIMLFQVFYIHADNEHWAFWSVKNVFS